MIKDISIYIHIPFCVKKCLYCDFNSFPNMSEYFESYKNSLINEIKNFKHTDEIIVKTIFIGGGTPSILPAEYIIEILNTIYNKFTVEKNAEISIEVNPGTLDYQKFKYYKKYGINRISIGIQSFNDNLLKYIGRIHNSEQAYKCFEYAEKAEFNNINIDLMFALPKQDIKDWINSLNSALKLNPSHLSIYSLIIEENTPFFEMFNKGEIKTISDEEDRKMYYTAREILNTNSFKQYEISNFAKNGFNCVHNIVYWKRKEYIGFGLGACSFFKGKRYHKNYNLKQYISGNYFGDFEEYSKKDAYAEFMFLGLRMTEGVSRKDFFNYFGNSLDDIFGNVVKKLVELKLLSDNGEKLRLTEKGIDISNTVFIEFL